MACLVSPLLPRVQRAILLQTISPLVNLNTSMRRPSTGRYAHHHHPLHLIRDTVSLVVTPASSMGPADDPFAPVNIPVTISLPNEGPSVIPNIQGIDSPYPPNSSAEPPADPGKQKKKADTGFRRTIQVETRTILTPRSRSPGLAMEKPLELTHLLLVPDPSRAPSLVIARCPDHVPPPVHLGRRSL